MDLRLGKGKWWLPLKLDMKWMEDQVLNVDRIDRRGERSERRVIPQKWICFDNREKAVINP